MTMTRGEIIAAAAKGRLRGADLSGIDLSGIDLSGADLARAILTDAKLTRANLSGATMTGAKLTHVDLTVACLSHADLTRVNLTGADLTGACLSHAALFEAKLTRANLSGTDLREARLRGADLTGATLPPHQVCPEVGAFRAYKKLINGQVITLEVPAAARRTSSLVGRKCRAEFALVIQGSGVSQKGGEYREGEIFHPDSYDDDVRIECTHGVHFFMTYQEAEEF